MELGDLLGGFAESGRSGERLRPALAFDFAEQAELWMADAIRARAVTGRFPAPVRGTDTVPGRKSPRVRNCCKSLLRVASSSAKDWGTRHLLIHILRT
jgi:hypothetical protein